MDPLVTAAATALVGAIMGDAWAASRDAVVDVWHRVNPRRTRMIEAALDEATEESERVRSDPAAELRSSELEEDWQQLFHALLRDAPGPGTRAEVVRLIRERLAPGLPDPEQRANLVTLVNNLSVSGNGQAAVAGGNVYWNTRG